ncbi:hypothetical protein MPSEU_000500200 [Mayamaea pseudoterrestris]|nr:hypothetical protein MPSEU_000500200 [Mayamaea pseudoterrestris]
MALQCMSTVALHIFQASAVHVRKAGVDAKTCHQTLHQLPVAKALATARDHFFNQAMQSSELLGDEIFLNIVECAIKSRYKRGSFNARFDSTALVPYTCLLSHYGAEAFSTKPEILIRQLRVVTLNNIERSRFVTEMAVHFRAACRILGRYESQIHSCFAGNVTKMVKLGVMSDSLDELADIFGTQRYDLVGTDVDIRGKRFFRFKTHDHLAPSVEAKHDELAPSIEEKHYRAPAYSEMTPQGQLILVIDAIDLLILKPIVRCDTHRCALVCNIPLLRIIAAACDGAWLHIAVQHYDVSHLIKNGNMALHFDSAGTCLTIAQHLKRHRIELRSKTISKIKRIFDVAIDEEMSAGSSAATINDEKK